MRDQDKSLYRQHLEKQGFTSTRACDLDVAVKKLHLAICQIDFSTAQRKALGNMMSGSVRDLIDEFAVIEELRQAHEIEGTG